MLKTEIQTQFDYLIAKVLWPVFKVHGYRKTGNNFRYYDTLGWGKIVNVQKSAFSSKDDITFTLNTGLYLSKADQIWTGRVAGLNFSEPDCLIRTRIGKLLGVNYDLWYELTENTITKNLFDEVEKVVIDCILPYLEDIMSLDDIVRKILKERRPNSAQAISTVFACGYHSEARQWLAEELATTNSRSHRQQMESIKSLLLS